MYDRVLHNNHCIKYRNFTQFPSCENFVKTLPDSFGWFTQNYAETVPFHKHQEIMSNYVFYVVNEKWILNPFPWLKNSKIFKKHQDILWYL